MKKAITTITLATVLMFGSTFANAGIIIVGRTSESTVKSDSCPSPTNEGIIIVGLAAVVAKVLTGIIIVGKETTPCSAPANEGIIIVG